MANPDQREIPVSGEILPAAEPLAPGQDRAIVAEIDRQVATARRYPRDISSFMKESLSLATLNADVAASCYYKLPRAGKMIEGPSVRLAEIIASCWGHMRAETRVVDESDRFITSRATAFDLQRNVAIAFEVRRRITNSKGERYSDDMITQTANAGNAIALRNAIFRVVPKAFWEPVYDSAKETARGNLKSLAERRATALEKFAKLGVPAQRIFDSLKIKGIEDIDLDVLETLFGIYTALKDGDVKMDDAFPLAKPETTEEEAAERKGALDGLKDRMRKAKEKDQPKPKAEAAPEPPAQTEGQSPKPEAPSPEPTTPPANEPPAAVDTTTGEELTDTEKKLADALDFGGQPPADQKKGGKK